MAVQYEVLEPVSYTTSSPSRGTQQFTFKPGVLTPTEDERFVLDRELVPAGLARRVTRKTLTEGVR